MRVLRVLVLIVGVVLVVGMMTVGALRDASGFMATVWTMGLGLVGLALAVSLGALVVEDRDHLPMIACVSFIGMFLLLPPFAYYAPRLRVAIRASAPAQDVAVATLGSGRLRLPARVRLRGIARPDLAMRGTYKVTAHKQTSEVSFVRMPIVDATWRSGDAVPVVTDRLTPAGEVTIEGVLFPLAPLEGELPAPDGVVDDFGRIGLSRLNLRSDGFYLQAGR